MQKTTGQARWLPTAAEERRQRGQEGAAGGGNGGSPAGPPHRRRRRDPRDFPPPGGDTTARADEAERPFDDVVLVLRGAHALGRAELARALLREVDACEQYSARADPASPRGDRVCRLFANPEGLALLRLVAYPRGSGPNRTAGVAVPGGYGRPVYEAPPHMVHLREESDRGSGHRDGHGDDDDDDDDDDDGDADADADDGDDDADPWGRGRDTPPHASDSGLGFCDDDDDDDIDDHFYPPPGYGVVPKPPGQKNKKNLGINTAKRSFQELYEVSDSGEYDDLSAAPERPAKTQKIDPPIHDLTSSDEDEGTTSPWSLQLLKEQGERLEAELQRLRQQQRQYDPLGIAAIPFI